MLTAALDGLVARFGLAGRAGRRGRRRRGAQALPRLQPDPRGRAGLPAVARDPAYDVQQACGTGLEAADPGRQQDRARARSSPASPVASTRATTPRSRSTRACARRLLDAQPRQDARRSGSRRSPACARASSSRRSRATPSRAPACRWASTRPSPRRSGASAARRRTSSPPRSHRNLAAAYDRGFFDDLVTPYLGLTRDQNLRPDTSVEKLATLKPVFGDGRRTRR